VATPGEEPSDKDACEYPVPFVQPDSQPALAVGTPVDEALV